MWYLPAGVVLLVILAALIITGESIHGLFKGLNVPFLSEIGPHSMPVNRGVASLDLKKKRLFFCCFLP